MKNRFLQKIVVLSILFMGAFVSTAKAQMYEFKFHDYSTHYNILLWNDAYQGWQGRVVYYAYGRRCLVQESFRPVTYGNGCVELYGHTPVVLCGSNGYYADHFLICPDGTFRGWDYQGKTMVVYDVRKISRSTFNYLLNNKYYSCR